MAGRSQESGSADGRPTGRYKEEKEKGEGEGQAAGERGRAASESEVRRARRRQRGQQLAASGAVCGGWACAWRVGFMQQVAQVGARG